MDLVALVTDLRRQNSDTARCEVKLAQGGFPDNVAETLSAFSNTPGGGILIFGLDQAHGFSPTKVYDVAKCQQAVAGVCRDALAPGIIVTTKTEILDGVEVVIVHVPEVDRALKPIRVKRTGKAYLRQYDGDYPMAELEEQALMAARGQPVFDEETVQGATDQDLDAEAVSAYIRLRRGEARVFSAMTDPEVLLRTGVLAADGRPTLAGLLAFGIYPQQFFPNGAVQASFVPGSGAAGSARVLESALLVGSIPQMLQDAIDWVSRATARAIADTAGGTVLDVPEYPEVVVRELIANALIHRDLGPHARSTPVTLRVEPRQLVISNPGGLLGLRVEALGRTPSHSRNARLTEILQSVRTAAGSRVVERLGSGIPAVIDALAAAGTPPPVFHDLGVSFTVRVQSRHSRLASPAHAASAKGSAWQPGGDPNGLGGNHDAVLNALAAGTSTVRQLVAVTGFTARQVRYALTQLEAAGLARSDPLDGRSKRYRSTG
ncbi:MAG: putative DNA binding domain-containing protein [Bifidobacteriaceae bacterium]|jgi:ATP-dependent DNA helicase RecG|nr:putative DNA binding domain-containing protein [Bifidobacteriaceae bacterium]